ncbi:transposon Tn10 TetD protein [Oxobacter pfennigii]|uniref:Transposon Tn10 TetD protein n=1 Tax=Oxobacter pfennigii TaxID=36849 RepID=A0A0P8W817_9CLOT|nr:helix-turn-helix transcriptional regulator [Oxobacter pfennigii]KPU44820.1 transposon Tn10 TetD protein [Oxobacter pfennigii]
MEYATKIQKSINFIENNLCEKLKLSDIAKQSYFSEFYFHKLFRNVTGAPVMEYIRQRRLNEASNDLLRTDEKITDIAFKYQFSSEESFSRAFKRVFGLSPRKYRNMINENVHVLQKHSVKNTPVETIVSMAA